MSRANSTSRISHAARFQSNAKNSWASCAAVITSKYLIAPCVILDFSTASKRRWAAMTARLLDGTKIRDEIFAELKSEIARLPGDGIHPGLAAVLVGENPASQLYVKSKIAACEQLGLASWMHTPAASITTDQMLRLVHDL